MGVIMVALAAITGPWASTLCTRGAPQHDTDADGSKNLDADTPSLRRRAIRAETTARTAMEAEQRKKVVAAACDLWTALARKRVRVADCVRGLVDVIAGGTNHSESNKRKVRRNARCRVV